MLSDADLDAIIDRTRTGEVSVGKVQGAVKKAAADYKADEALIPTRQLQGVMYESMPAVKIEDMQDIVSEWKKQARKVRNKGGGGGQKWFERVLCLTRGERAAESKGYISIGNEGGCVMVMWVGKGKATCDHGGEQWQWLWQGPHPGAELQLLRSGGEDIHIQPTTTNSPIQWILIMASLFAVHNPIRLVFGC